MEPPAFYTPATTAELVQPTPKNYPPLEQVSKPNLTTAELAFYSNMGA